MTGTFNLNHLILFVFGMLLFTAVMFGDPTRVRALAIEDGVIENATALLYLAGAVACVNALFRGQTRLFVPIWLVLCIVFLGEETSWFQRLLGYSVPEVEAINSQREFNLHNIYFWHDIKLIDGDGRLYFDMKRLPGSQTLFRLGFLIYFLAIPIVIALIPPLGRFADRLGYPKMGAGFLIAVWAVIITSIIYTLNSVPLARHPIAEVREMFYALVICLHTFGFIAHRHAPSHSVTSTPSASKRTTLSGRASPIY